MTVKTVLLVDDSRVARMMTRKTVATHFPDWRIEEAGTGEEALAIAPALAPDFVVLDVNMPGIDGLETAKRLRQVVPSARITLLTANIQSAMRQHAEEIGVGFLNKPFREEDLVAFLRGASA